MNSALRLGSASQEYEQVWRTVRSRVDLLWTGLLYLCGAVGFASLRQREDAGLWLVSGAGLLFLLCCALYHMLYLPSVSQWSLTGRFAAWYFCSQLVIVGALTLLHPGFSLLGWVVIGQVVVRLPHQVWLVPLTGIGLVLLGGGWIANQIAPPPWLMALGMIVGMVCCAALAWLLATVIEQRQCLLRLVADLQRARWEAEHAAVEGELLAAMHERTRVARDVHDGLGHLLTGLGIKLETAAQFYCTDPERGLCELRESRELVHEAMQELRRSLLTLRAPLPDIGDLAQALRTTAAEVGARSHLLVSLDLPDPFPELAPRLSETLWRVTREALTNVERHAAAASASVQVCLDEQRLTLRIIDDGSGVRPADFKRPGHYGLVGMRERVEACRGTLHISAPAAGGTCVEARIPLPAGVSTHRRPAPSEGTNV